MPAEWIRTLHDGNGATMKSRFDTTTDAQRRAHDEHPRSHNADEDPREQLEQDERAFRHFDSMTFAPHPRGTPGANTGGELSPGSPPASSGARDLPQVAVGGNRPNAGSPVQPPCAGGPASTSAWTVHAFRPEPLSADVAAQREHRLSSVEDPFDSDEQTLADWRAR